jgi:hypothetical protein
MRILQLTVVALFVVLGAASTSANAGKACFGMGEELRPIAKTGLKDSAGNSLELAAKRTMWCFLLPYSIVDDGLVLKPKGESSSYYKLPPMEEVARMQAAGLLPRPLPKPELSTLDLVVGHSFFVLLVVLALGCGYIWWAGRSQRHSAA